MSGNRVLLTAHCLLLTVYFSVLTPSVLAADAPSPRQAAAAVLRKQVEIVQTIQQVAKDMDVETPAENRIRTILYSLGSNELLNSSRLLEKLLAARTDDDFGKVRTEALAAQDRAIKVLQEIVGVVKLMETQTKKEALPPQGADMPPELRDKMEDLYKKLKDFQKDQKKVMETTADLAKTPVDDFTADQEQKLKEATAVQDKWASFLEEKHTDLSKMAVQDASVESMLKELAEVYSEVKAAKDALSQKAMEIATPAEAGGAELAKSLETNIEKWLPDYAERTKWQMEEPLQDYQVPMAELPKELEDLVGDLMEEEEDLMQDAEDATSSWADSIDKGAGWDALDGPISSFSAKGVTGNHLPNQSEISGRSGEGRTGKAAGEFVEDKASGKGGRRTPTRLTPDPFSKGVIDDRSQEAPGGATGGGKMSGSGQEGLEGPVPPQIKQQLDRLAGRQAELRNKAERIQLGFKVMNYPSESISRTIRTMKGLEDDLRSGRYQNIARRRDVMLKEMQDSQLLARGEVRVLRDYNAPLPTHLEDEIREAQGEPTPAGYEDLLKGYYEALSRQK